MISPHAAIADAAEGLVGTPFLLLGRDPQRGLDCVGVLLVALDAAGCTPHVPVHYTLRRTAIDDFVAAAARTGLLPTDRLFRAGDIVVVRPATAQFHAAVIVHNGRYVHAHAGLRQVISSALPMPWPVEHHWQLGPD